MKVEIFNRDWNIDDIKSNKNKLYIFGDNNARVGKGGQAIIRDLPNTLGIRTKKGPSNKPVAFLSDNELDINIKNIREDILNIVYQMDKYSHVVLSSGGYGTGLAQLERFAPKTFENLNKLLEGYFRFDNKSGIIKKVIPSHSEISTANYISLDGKSFESGVLSPVNNSYFKPEFLSVGLNTYFDLIKEGKKISFTYPISHNFGEIIILVTNNKYLICRIVDSYDYKLVDGDKWSVFEGFNNSFINEIDIDTTLYQNHIEYIGVLNSDGVIEFNDDLFNKLDSKSVSTKTIGNKVYSVNKDSKMLRVEKLLLDEGLIGDIESTSTNNTYQLLSNGIYYLIQYKDYFLWDTIKIILSSENRII